MAASTVLSKIKCNLHLVNRRLFVNCLQRAASYSSSERSPIISKHLEKLESLQKRKDILHHRREILKAIRHDPLLEKAIRERKLKIPLSTVKKEWSKDKGLREVAFLARYYGIFRDIFNGNEFKPSLWLDVSFENTPVHRGNILQPSQCLEKPSISFDLSSHPFYLVLLLNPDGCHPFAHAEVLHWMKFNIKDKQTESNDELSYIPPLPWKGSGFHRFCVAVFGQSKIIDKMVLEKLNHERLKFKTADLLDKLGNTLTPVGLSWFQAEWDESVKDTAREFGIFEPIFEWEQLRSPKQINIERKHKKLNNKYRIKFTDNDILLAK